MIPAEDAFVAAVEKTITRYHMVTLGETILVGVSGGPDSSALLHCLVALRGKWSLTLVVGHLNHGIRKTRADQEADFVARLAASLGLPCEISKRDVKSFCSDHGLSLQEGARKVRYGFYETVAEVYGAQKVAVGHQADDNAESVMMHFLRGTGPAGLAGIPVRRPALVETTALGAAGLAGLSAGVWSDAVEFGEALGEARLFQPHPLPPSRDRLMAGWRRALTAVEAWSEAGELQDLQAMEEE